MPQPYHCRSGFQVASTYLPSGPLLYRIPHHYQPPFHSHHSHYCLPQNTIFARSPFHIQNGFHVIHGVRENAPSLRFTKNSSPHNSPLQTPPPG
ncbi:hypothetical protein BDZ91DRAFT_714445 [Kalaharituber pfeilii]|nr:hypothetical protein BDZ91DRAFT_714445 [Kalaharituber pfeilii]